MKREKGDITLFALLKMDELTDKWSIVLCASWVNDETRAGEAFAYLRNIILEQITQDESASIARIGIFSKDEHLIKALLNYRTGAVIQNDEKINGNIVHEGYILEANPVV